MDLVVGGGGVETDGLSISSGNVVIRGGKPGIAMATVTTPGSPKRVVYCLIFTHDPSTSTVTTKATSEGTTATTFHNIESFKHPCPVKYYIELDVEDRTVAGETLSLNGANFEPTNGRVFLIDFEDNPPAVTQLLLELPSEVPDLSNVEQMEQFGTETLKTLRGNDQRAEDFCHQFELECQKQLIKQL